MDKQTPKNPHCLAAFINAIVMDISSLFPKCKSLTSTQSTRNDMDKPTPRTDAVYYIDDIIKLSRQLETELADANARAEAALEMLDEKNCPRKYVKQGGILYCLHGSSSISAYEALQSRLREVAEKVYLAGFNASGEGYNGEYPFYDKKWNPAEDTDWIAQRALDIDAIIKE